MALTYRGIDIMGWTKDYLRNNFSQAEIEAHIGALCRDFPGITHIAIAVPMNTQAEATAESVTAFTTEPAAYAKLFMDAIHAEGKKVIFRGTDCYFEGIYNFPKDTGKSNGNRASVMGEQITDNFSAGVRNHGVGLTSSDASVSDNYLTAHQSSNTWTIADGYITGPTASGWLRTCLFNASAQVNVVVQAKVLSSGSNNIQIVARASTDSNFPGYGLQMRGANTLRIERPGIANLGEVTNKTFTNGVWYNLKLECNGTTIRGKSWPDGDVEPGTWDISITDATHSNGYCGFGGESNGVKIDDFSFTPSPLTNTWMYRAYNWVTTNIADFADGDMVVPYPEASFHQTLTNNGTYNQFFIDLAYVLGRAGTDNSKTFVTNAYGHGFTSVLQNSYNSQFTEFNLATYDHYGTSIGPGKRFASYDQQNTSASNTYTCPTSINEGATHKYSFYPEKTAYNTEIDVWVVSKGTGDLTMTIHDASNNPVKMVDNTDLSILTNSYQATITNANLVNGAMNTFAIDWWNPNPDVQYHFHLTSSTGDATVSTSTASDLSTVRNRAYKGNASPEAYEIDIRNAYAKTGVPQFIQEWGDYWSTDSNLSSPVRNQTDHTAYLESFTAMLQRLVDDGILVGFNYWRALGGHEAIYTAVSDLTNVNNYARNYEGDVFNTFFNANVPEQVAELIGRSAATRSAMSGRSAASRSTITSRSDLT